jgi:hypothetical protein
MKVMHSPVVVNLEPTRNEDVAAKDDTNVTNSVTTNVVDAMTLNEVEVAQGNLVIDTTNTTNVVSEVAASNELATTRDDVARAKIHHVGNTASRANLRHSQP